jgi:hypothetical protein
VRLRLRSLVLLGAPVSLSAEVRNSCLPREGPSSAAPTREATNWRLTVKTLNALLDQQAGPEIAFEEASPFTPGIPVAPPPKKRKKASTSPTQRSLAHLRKEGYTVAIVEHWNPHARLRQDLFGFVDLLAIRRGETLALQTTSGDHVAERIEKIAEHPNLWKVREAGWRVVVHGWRKLRKSNRWELRVEDIS